MTQNDGFCMQAVGGRGDKELFCALQGMAILDCENSRL